MKNFNIEANNIKEELIEVRRTLHQYPELGFEETNTSKFIKEFLTKEGIEFKEFAGTGVCGIIKGTKEGINKWEEAMCIQKTDKNKIEEELFIKFLKDQEN